MTSAAAESIVAAMSAWPQGAGSATAVIESLSGAVGDVGPPTAPSRGGDRRHAFSGTPRRRVDTAGNWLARAHAAVPPSSVGGYVNYVELGTPLGTVSRTESVADSTLFGSSTIRAG